MYSFVSFGRLGLAPAKRSFAGKAVGKAVLPCKNRWFLGALAFGAAAIAAPAANAQANLTFAGGSGTPLSLTLLNPVTYTVTTAINNGFPFGFIFKGVGNPLGGNTPDTTGTLTFRINNGAAQTLNQINSGVTGGAIAANDVYVYGTAATTTLNVGDIVTLASGTSTTTSNVAAARPANGTFTTFIVDGFQGGRLSANGVSITAAPEPASLALIGAGCVGMVGSLARRKHRT